MERIFWVACPDCGGKFFCDYELRSAGLDLQCPYCGKLFPVESSPWIDERK